MLKQRLNKAERKIITNNVVLNGLQEGSKENVVSSITHLFRSKLKVHLENSQIKNVFRLVVSEELTTKDREDRKILLETLKEARAKNKHAVIRGRTLIIEGKAYAVEDVKNFDEGNDYPTFSKIERHHPPLLLKK
ncbi:hypothetical protein JTB14_019773 [Gonioctena quinquepunctata]|nr:hypothetical protein JTB14_019773 [Gonioctena quinquepunctata]